MSAYDPPSLVSSIFNNNNFTNLSGSLDISSADKRYLRLTGGNVTGNCTMRDITMNALTSSILTGDNLTIRSTSLNSRATIKFQCPGNTDLEIGYRSAETSSYPRHYYRYMDGAYRWVQDPNGNSINLGKFTVDTSSNHLTLKNGSESSILDHSSSQLKISSSVSSSFAYINSTGFGVSATANHITLKNGSNSSIIEHNSENFLKISSSVSSSFAYINSIGFGVLASGNHLTLRNGANSVFSEITSSDIFRQVRGLSLNLDQNGLRIDGSSNTASARSRLDLGADATNKGLSLFNNTSSYYGVSANNNALQYQSFQNHLWTTGSSDASPLGTTIMSLSNTGSLTCNDNTVLKRGFFIERQPFSSSGRTGRGISGFFANADPVAKIFAYDYNTNNFEGLQLGNCMLVNGQNGGRVTIDNNITTSGNYPLTVASWFSTSFSGSFGFLNTSGAGSSVNTGVCDVSIYANKQVWCQQVNVFSDRRLKKNINELNEDDSIDFIRNVMPVSFNWRDDKDQKRSIGYTAQSILQHEKFPELVSFGSDDSLEEEVEIIGNRKFISPKGIRFNVCYQNAVPILHRALASLYDIVESNQEEIERLISRIDELEKKSDNHMKRN
jgi:hypothetical protein